VGGASRPHITYIPQQLLSAPQLLGRLYFFTYPEGKVDDWKDITVEWQGQGAFIGSNVSGGEVQMGLLGEKPGISPMELVLVALGGCTGVDVASILEKMRQPLKGLRLRVRGKRSTSYPRVYTEIEVQYLLCGKGLDEEAVRQAIELSKEKYCSVSGMLKASVDIQFSYQILPDSGEMMIE
jgi:putative redox protein